MGLVIIESFQFFSTPLKEFKVTLKKAQMVQYFEWFEQARSKSLKSLLWNTNLKRGQSRTIRIQEKNEPSQNFVISRFYPMFPRFFTTFPLFALLVNFSRFASANVAVVWIRAWRYFLISYKMKLPIEKLSGAYLTWRMKIIVVTLKKIIWDYLSFESHTIQHTSLFLILSHSQVY